MLTCIHIRVVLLCGICTCAYKFVENWKLDGDLQPQVYLAFMFNDN
jgi:hypothetical protein